MEMLDILSLAEKINNAIPNGLNEANTKTSLIMPFLTMMGYDVFDHTEVAQEYTSEFGTKKGEKVDIAILKDGEPIILIECKPLGDPLDTGKCSQLFRYFTVKPQVRIGILTNGQRYLFFSDLERQNVMDNKPFMEIDILNFNERVLPELQKLTKDAWDLEAALSSAETLKYTRAIKILVQQDMQEPSENVVRYYATQCYDGKMTHKAIEMFRPIVKRAFSEHISDLITRRLNIIQTAEEEVQNSTPLDLQNNQYSDEEDNDTDIITYNNEIFAYFIIRSLLSKSVEPSRVVMRDQKTYCGILLDDNNRKPICRLFNVIDCVNGEEGIGKNAYIVIMTENNNKGERYNLTCLDDIYPLAEKLEQAVNRHEQK